jgi:hypothetical protein
MNTMRLQEFTKFLDKELVPAIADVATLTDANRKHVQKLVYTNLVDRFDHVVDQFILDNCREENLISKAFEGDDRPVNESYVINLLLQSHDLQSALDSRLQDKLRLSVLRQRHSRKLFTLLSLCNGAGNVDKKPRVNPSTGRIFESFSPQFQTTPHSICGYADWLYSRRNAVVHGAGTSAFLENDRRQIKKQYNVDVAKTFKLSLASIRIAVEFYRGVTDLIK